MIAPCQQYNLGKSPMRSGRASNRSCLGAILAWGQDASTNGGRAGAQTDFAARDFRCHRLCASHRLPVEGTAQELWQRQCHSPLLSAVAAGRILRAAVASWVGGVRRHGGDCLGMAKLGRDSRQSSLGARGGGKQPNRSGEKKEPSAVCWWTVVAPRSRLSSPGPIGTT